MADNTAKIAELEAILDAGVTTINVEGTVTTIDLNVIRQQLRDLRATDDTQKTRKPRIATLDVSGLM